MRCTRQIAISPLKRASSSIFWSSGLAKTRPGTTSKRSAKLGPRRAPQQIRVHDPSLALSLFGARLFDGVDALLEFAGDQDLIRSAKVRTPENIDIFVDQGSEA